MNVYWTNLIRSDMKWVENLAVSEKDLLKTCILMILTHVLAYFNPFISFLLFRFRLIPLDLSWEKGRVILYKAEAHEQNEIEE